MARIVTALHGDEIIGIESIFTVRDDGKQIYDEEKYDYVRTLSQNGEDWTKEQHFRHLYEDQDRKCFGITEGPVSIDSRKIIKCWLSDKLRSDDIKSRVSICSIRDTKRKFEFSFLSESRNIALCYWYTGANIQKEKLEILDENKKELRIIHILDESNSGCPNGQYQDHLMKIQTKQGYCLFLSVEGSDYKKATLKAAIYRENEEKLWEETVFAKGKLSQFHLYKGDVWFNFETLPNRALAANIDFSSEIEERIAEKKAEEAQKEKERLQRIADYEKRKAELEAEQAQREAEKLQMIADEERRKAELAAEAEAKKIAKEQEKEDFKEHLSESLEKSDVALTDPDGVTWLKCRKCGMIGNPVDFISEYNGSKLRNPGICKKCHKNEDEEREKLKLERMNKAHTCEKCGRKLVIRRRKADGREFYACPNYDCHYTKSIF